MSDSQRDAVYAIYRDLLEFSSQKSEAEWSRGRKTLLQALESLSSAGPAVPASGKLPAAAKAVDPDRVSLPAVAGVLTPEDHLEPRLAEILRTLRKIEVPSSELPRHLPGSCHWISEVDEGVLRERLVDSGMVEFIPFDSVPHDRYGRKLVSGLFTVEHKAESDRLIIDRRALNAGEHRLKWCTLPHGSLLTQIRLGPGEVLRGSGDDLSNYFYLLSNPPNWRHRCAIGRPFYGRELPGSGLASDERFFLGLKVWAMGDHNSVDVAQVTHEHILANAGGLRKGEQLVYGKPVGRGKTFEGVYIDDHLVVGVVPREVADDPGSNHDSVLLEASREAYAKLGLPCSKSKSFTRATRFTAWGTEVDGISGKCGAPVERRVQLFMLTCLTLALGRVSKALMSSLLGSYVHPFCHRRELMSIFGTSFRWCSRLPERGSCWLPAAVCDELLAAAVHLPLAEVNLRDPISTKIHFADATPTGGGSVSSLVSRDLAEGLYDFGEHKGNYVRLDWGPVSWSLREWTDRELPPRIEKGSSMCKLACR